MSGVLIVGASAAGLTTAEALRRAGFEEDIALVGAEPELPYDRPPLSKQFMTGVWEAEKLALRDVAALSMLTLDLHLGTTATGLDTEEKLATLSDGNVAAFETLVVATGVRPRELRGTGSVTGVHVLRTLADATALKKAIGPGRRFVVVGAGFLGAEVADAAKRQGAEVTLLESDAQPMARAVGEQAGQFLAQLHRERGIDLRTGVAVAELLHEGGEVTGVGLTDGTTVPADDVLVAIGSVPNTEWLAGNGLVVQDGLLCDEYCVAAPHVYGVGDVARWFNPLFGTSMRIEHRTNAAEQALTVAANIVNPELARPFAPVPYVWSDQLGVRIQTYGYLPEYNEEHVLECDLGSRRLLIAYRRNQYLTGILAIGLPPKALRSWRALIAGSASWEAAITSAAA